ncbi:type IV pilus twitching motility protein PilT [Patescibacteria group bacterium]|nr:type IV pilus twitching motility protein PilT [Patescibacteria group bacterium]
MDPNQPNQNPNQAPGDQPATPPERPKGIAVDSKVPNDPEQQMGQLLQLMVSHEASDLILSVGVQPSIRIDGILHPIEDHPVLTPERTEALIGTIMTVDQQERFKKQKELDFSIPFEEKARFRVNVYHQRGFPAAALRLIPMILKNYQELNLPAEVGMFARMKQGLVLFAGPTGHGKSTTQAAIIDDINANRADHIVTIEDPIEYTHLHKQSIVDQREVGSDTDSFARALRSVLREDPDVVLVGEMRDPETMASAMTIAETGHLVFATVHTNDAPQTIDRIVDSFPSYQQNQVRSQLAQVLQGVVSQRLLPQIGGGRVPAVEIMIATPAVQNLIREGKTHQIPGVIQTSSEDGMVSMEKALAERVQEGLVKYDDAVLYANDVKTLGKLVKGF